MNSTQLEHVVGGVALIVGGVIAVGLVAAYFAWVVGGRK